MTLLDWYEQLAAGPADWTTRLALADWLEEREDPLAMVQRWLAKNKKHPMFYQDQRWYWGTLALLKLYNNRRRVPLAIEYQWVRPTWLLDVPLFEKLRDRANPYHKYREAARFPMIANYDYWVVYGGGGKGLLLAERELSRALEE